MLANNLYNYLLGVKIHAEFHWKFTTRAVLIFKCLISIVQREPQVCLTIEKHHKVNSGMHKYKLQVIFSRQSVHVGHHIIFITLYIDEGR